MWGGVIQCILRSEDNFLELAVFFHLMRVPGIKLGHLCSKVYPLSNLSGTWIYLLGSVFVKCELYAAKIILIV